MLHIDVRGRARSLPLESFYGAGHTTEPAKPHETVKSPLRKATPSGLAPSATASPAKALKSNIPLAPPPPKAAASKIPPAPAPPPKRQMATAPAVAAAVPLAPPPPPKNLTAGVRFPPFVLRAQRFWVHVLEKYVSQVQITAIYHKQASAMTALCIIQGLI